MPIVVGMCFTAIGLHKSKVIVRVSLARPQGFDTQVIQILKSKPLESVKIQSKIEDQRLHAKLTFDSNFADSSCAVNRYVWPDNLFEECQNLSWLRMPFLYRLLRKNKLAVNLHLKRPFATGDKGKRFDNVLILTQNFIRHTDGSLAVVSGYAIFN